MNQAGWAVLANTVGVAVWTGARAGVPDAGAPERTRDPRQAAARLKEDDEATRAATRPAHLDAASDEELRRTDGAVADCRVEVARRRRLPLAKVAAGTVVVQFTIEKSG